MRSKFQYTLGRTECLVIWRTEHDRCDLNPWRTERSWPIPSWFRTIEPLYIYIEGSRLAKELSKKKRMIWCAKPNNKLYLILPFGLLHKLKKTVFWAYHITQNDAKKQPTSQQLRPTWPRNCREFAEACHKNDAALPLKSLHGTAQIQGCGWWLYWGIWPCLVFAPCWFSGTYGINPLFCSDGELPFPF